MEGTCRRAPAPTSWCTTTSGTIRRLLLPHPLDRSAVDVWIPTHLDEVGAVSVSVVPRVPRTAGTHAECATTFVRVDSNSCALRPNVIGQHLSAMLDVRPDAQVLQLLADATLDEWAADHSAYSLLRLWAAARARRHVVLHQLLDNEVVFGTYGVLEARLYLRAAAPPGWSTSSERGPGVRGAWDQGLRSGFGSRWSAWRVPTDPGRVSGGHERRCDATRRSAARCRSWPISPRRRWRGRAVHRSPESLTVLLAPAQGCSQSGW